MKNNFDFKNSVLTVTITLSFGAPQAFAFDLKDINQTNYEKVFKELDTDNNGILSIAEARKTEFFTEKHFSRADTNHDESLSQEEFTNYKSKIEKKNLKRVVSDSAITSKIKAKLLLDEGLKSLKVSVETHKGTVILSGFVKKD